MNFKDVMESAIKAGVSAVAWIGVAVLFLPKLIDEDMEFFSGISSILDSIFSDGWYYGLLLVLVGLSQSGGKPRRKAGKAHKNG